MKPDLRSMEQYTTSQLIELKAVVDRRLWRQWFEGDFAQLFPPASTDNGTIIANSDTMIESNYLNVGSRFLANAVIKDEMSVSSSEKTFESWWVKHEHYVIQQLNEAIEAWSHGGRSALIAYEDGQLLPVQAENTLVVGDTFGREDRRGYIFPWRFPEFSQLDLISPNVTRIPDRILIQKYSPEEGYNSSELYELNGTLVGQRLQSEPAGIRDVLFIGDDDSFYPRVKSLFAALLVRQTINHVLLNRDANRPAIVPGLVLDEVAQEMGNMLTVSQAWAKLLETRKPVLSTQAGAGNTEASSVDVGEARRLMEGGAQFDALFRQFYLLAEIPPTAFGVDVGRGESGTARERTTDQARAKVQKVRNAISRLLPRMLVALGCPVAAENINVHWRNAPFYDHNAQNEMNIRLYEAGIMTLEETRKEFGLAAEPTGQLAQQREDVVQSNENPESGEERT